MCCCNSPNVNGTQTEPLQVGYNRFRFGFAAAGDTIDMNGKRILFLGDFGRKRDAIACQSANPGSTVKGYLNGKRKRGWVLWTESENAAIESWLLTAAR